MTDQLEISFNKLNNHLEDMTKQYRLLLDCIRKEKDLLILTDIEKLNENNLIKEQLLFKIKNLDQIRINYAINFAQIIGASTEQVRLLELAQKVGGQFGDKLRLHHSTLELIIKRMADINKSNEKYAESALKNVSMAMESFKDKLVGPQKTYNKKGKYSPKHDRSGHLASKEA